MDWIKVDYKRFLLDEIRQGGKQYSWMEERRLEFGPLIISKIPSILEGKSVLICVDDERLWFENYILSQINAKPSRPFLPFYSLKGLFKKPCESDSDIALLNDLLELSFPNGYFFFYIGRADKRAARLPCESDDSLLWLLDEQLHDSFYLSSHDKELDFKLISLYKLLDTSLDGLLFSQFELE